jgi:hypothetical protein
LLLCVKEMTGAEMEGAEEEGFEPSIPRQRPGPGL